MANRDELNTNAGTGANRGTSDWSTEDSYWRSTFSSRPYARGDQGYDVYQGAYRYGFESAKQHRGRKWSEVESDLRSGWDKYEYRAKSTWENVKDAVRDAWDRVTGRDDERTATSRDAGTTPQY